MLAVDVEGQPYFTLLQRPESLVTDLFHISGSFLPKQPAEGQPYFLLALPNELFLGVAEAQAIAECGLLAENTPTSQL